MKHFIHLFFFLFVVTYSYGQQDQMIYKYRQMAVEYQQKIKMAQSELAGAESMIEASKSDFLPI